MATKREKNSGKQQKRELWKKILLCILAAGFPVFLLLTYITHLPVNKPIDPEDTVTVTIQVRDTLFGQASRGGGRHGTSYRYYYLNIYTDSEIFRIEGPRDKEKSTEPGAYNMLALKDVIQSGDTLTITYRQYYPWLIPQKYVVDLREDNRVYRSLDTFNENLDGLVDDNILLVIGLLITLPWPLVALEIPNTIWRKVQKKRREKEKAAEKAAKQNKTAPD